MITASSTINSLAFRVFIILVVITGFFVVYSNYMMDKSLAALNTSLANLTAGEALGVTLLLDISSIEEISVENFDNIMASKLDYVDTTVLYRPYSADVQVILSNITENKKRKRGGFLNALDLVSNYVTDGINRIMGLLRRTDPDVLRKDLDKAITHHHEGRFKQADGLYREIIAASPASRYAKVARALRFNLRHQVALKAKKDNIIFQVKKLEGLAEPKDLANIYFNIGILSLRLLDFKTAQEYFNKVVELVPQLKIATRARFYLGFGSKQAGDLDRGLEYFEQVIKESKDKKIILSSKLQLADMLKREGKFEDVAELFKALSVEYEDSSIAPVLLKYLNFTYLYDLGDIEKAREIAAELMKKYPGSELLEEARLILEREKSVKRLVAKKETLATKIWTTTPVLKNIITQLEEAATWYSIEMIKGTIENALRGNKKKGDIVVIDLTADFLVNYVQGRMDKLSRVVDISFTNFGMSFPGHNQVRVQGIVTLRGRPFNCEFLGNMKLVKFKEPDLIEDAYNPGKWVVYELTEGKIGNFKIPVDVMNNAIRRSQRVFNQKQVFRIESLTLERGEQTRIIFGGPLRYDKPELIQQLRTLENYIKLSK